jgi:hypothetical protein
MKLREINKANYSDMATKAKLEFVSYSGAYPNLCSGRLVLKQGKKDWVFPDYCLRSGGGAGFSNAYQDAHVIKGKWAITEYPKDFPEELKEEATELVNEKVHKGCCGGCL